MCNNRRHCTTANVQISMIINYAINIYEHKNAALIRTSKKTLPITGPIQLSRISSSKADARKPAPMGMYSGCQQPVTSFEDVARRMNRTFFSQAVFQLPERHFSRSLSVIRLHSDQLI